jgi:type IX secretion system PorP/SprF family membrane protein
MKFSLSSNPFKKTGLVLLFLMGIYSLQSKAQLSPLGVQYFQSPYLANPALAGINQGYNLNIGYSQQWNSIPGAPVKQYVAGDFKMNERVGLGFHLYNDAAGLMNKTRFSGSYAYHLPLNEEGHKLHFGVSFGYMHERISNENIVGDLSDESIERFNARKNYLDGDFGIAYTNNRLTVQASVPNLKSTFKKDVANNLDRSTFFSAVSYKIIKGESMSEVIFEPKLCFRGVQGYANIADIGANVVVANNQLSFTGMYHTSKSATFGCGFNYKSMSIVGLYTTENTQLRGDANGIFEIGLQLNMKKGGL